MLGAPEPGAIAHAPMLARSSALYRPTGFIEPCLPTLARTVPNGAGWPYEIKQTQQFARLFMAPGMWHCQAGPGPNSFGGMIQQPVPFDPQHDLLSALTQWVEKGVAPTSVIATKYVNDTPQSGIQMQRPLCLYPQIPQYTGSGDPTLPTNFKCVTDELSDFNETPAPQYGP
jgi:tannase/feruloyl esterase